MTPEVRGTSKSSLGNEYILLEETEDSDGQFQGKTIRDITDVKTQRVNAAATPALQPKEANYRMNKTAIIAFSVYMSMTFFKLGQGAERKVVKEYETAFAVFNFVGMIALIAAQIGFLYVTLPPDKKKD